MAMGLKIIQRKRTSNQRNRETCRNETVFNNRIQSHTCLIDEMDVKELKKFIKTKITATGSINLLKAFLDENILHYDQKIIKNLRLIFTLRSKKFPIHRDDPKFLDALNQLGESFPPKSWENVWNKSLNLYFESLELLGENLRKLDS